MEEVKKYYNYLKHNNSFNKLLSMDGRKNQYENKEDLINKKYNICFKNLIAEKEEALKEMNIKTLDDIIERITDYLISIVLIDDINKIDYYKSNLKLEIFDFLIINNMNLDKRYYDNIRGFFCPDDMINIHNTYNRYNEINREKSIINKLDLINNEKLLISDKEYLYELKKILNNLYSILNGGVFKKKKELNNNSIDCPNRVNLLYKSIEGLINYVSHCINTNSKDTYLLEKKDDIEEINKLLRTINDKIDIFNFKKFQEFYEKSMEEKVSKDTNNIYFNSFYKNIPDYLNISKNEAKVIFDNFLKIYTFDKKSYLISNIIISKDINSILNIYEMVSSSKLDIDYSKINIKEFNDIKVSLEKALEFVECKGTIPRRSNGIIEDDDKNYVLKRIKK